MKGIRYDLVLIEWVDSVIGFQGWKVVREQSNKLTHFFSVGFLVYEDKNKVVLYPHIEKTKENNLSGSGDIIIPKKAILKREKLI